MAQSPSVHPDEAELFYVVDGSATMVTGGKIVGEPGKTIEGGVSQKFAKGDWLIVPAGVNHQFVDIKSRDHDYVAASAASEVGGRPTSDAISLKG